MNPPRPVAWITGAAGLIGNYLVQTAPLCAPDWKTAPITRDTLDLCDFAAVHQKFFNERPQLIIHCAALSRSPECQANPALARKLNVDATTCLAQMAAHIPFIFLSSDLVFDGREGNYDESAPPNPLTVYAETKVAAEKVVLANPRHTVVRTSLNGGISRSGNRAFNEELRNAWRAGQTPRLFVDEFRSPIPAIETARAIWQLVARNPAGVYHLAGGERLSRWQIGQLIAARWPRLNPRIEPRSLREYQGAPRLPDTSLNSSKIQNLLCSSLPGLTDWLESHPDEEF